MRFLELNWHQKINMQKGYLDMYKLSKNCTKDLLESFGFQYSSQFSVDDERVYFYRFPVYRNGADIMFEAEFRVNLTTGELLINVYDALSVNRWAIYAAWYNRDYGKNDVVEYIDRRIKNEIGRLGIFYEDDQHNQRKK